MLQNSKCNIGCMLNTYNCVLDVRQAFDHGPWPRMTGRERGQILYKFADLMEQNTHELAILESLDNGKPLSASK